MAEGEWNIWAYPKKENQTDRGRKPKGGDRRWLLGPDITNSVRTNALK